jgi:16S rRNA (cytidine1402-2'-O)-methyltransferase
MPHEPALPSAPLKAGLYIIGTPIGNMGDITLRALETLKGCQLIACEDTRVSHKLLSHYGVKAPLTVLHDHNEASKAPELAGAIMQGKAVALISDAGMPLLSDPGYKLVQLCREQGLYVTVLPGACSILAGLALSAMPPYPFMFCGFANPKSWHTWVETPATLVFFEAPHRIIKTLKNMATSFANRRVAVVREITKRFEETIEGRFEDVIAHVESHTPRGEMVVVLSPPKARETSASDLDAYLREALKTYSLRDASELAAQTFGVAKREAYQKALHIAKV